MPWILNFKNGVLTLFKILKWCLRCKSIHKGDQMTKAPKNHISWSWSWLVKIDEIENVTVKRTLEGFSLSLGFVCKCVSAKNVGSSLYLDLKKGLVVAAITFFILQVRPTTSNLISLVKLLMLSISISPV